MTTGKHDAAVNFDPSSESSLPSRKLRQWWSAIAALLVVAIFAQAVFAGLMLSGVDWGRAAHSANAVFLVAATVTAGVVAVVTLRRIPHGAKFGFALLALALVLVLQAVVGKSTAQGANLMWLHIPLGVALVGFAMQAMAGARRLGGA